MGFHPDDSREPALNRERKLARVRSGTAHDAAADDTTPDGGKDTRSTAHSVVGGERRRTWRPGRPKPPSHGDAAPPSRDTEHWTS